MGGSTRTTTNTTQNINKTQNYNGSKDFTKTENTKYDLNTKTTSTQNGNRFNNGLDVLNGTVSTGVQVFQMDKLQNLNLCSGEARWGCNNQQQLKVMLLII